MQRWLSLTGICDLLSTTENNIKWLVKNGYLEMIPGQPGRRYIDARFLDPTPEYARRLKICESLYGRRQHLPAELDLPGAPLFTITELAEILGWTLNKARKYVFERKIEDFSDRANLRLFSARQIRNILWRRGERKAAYRRAPYLLADLIDYFRRYEAAQREIVPSDVAYLADDALMKKWELMARMAPEDRDIAMQEFLEKVRVAREIVTASREGCRP